MSLPEPMNVSGLSGGFTRVYTDEKATALFRHDFGTSVMEVKFIQGGKGARKRHLIRLENIKPATSTTPVSSETMTLTIDHPVTGGSSVTDLQFLLGCLSSIATSEHGSRLIGGEL